MCVYIYMYIYLYIYICIMCVCYIQRVSGYSNIIPHV